jgi:hypothetical protein
VVGRQRELQVGEVPRRTAGWADGQVEQEFAIGSAVDRQRSGHDAEGAVDSRGGPGGFDHQQVVVHHLSLGPSRPAAASAGGVRSGPRPSRVARRRNSYGAVEDRAGAVEGFVHRCRSWIGRGERRRGRGLRRLVAWRRCRRERSRWEALPPVRSSDRRRKRHPARHERQPALHGRPDPQPTERAGHGHGGMDDEELLAYGCGENDRWTEHDTAHLACRSR